MTAGDRRFVSAILVAFAGIGAFEALVGIFGIVGYSVSRRRREFGVRMALGARATGIRTEILSALARSVLPGVLLGLLAAAMLSRTLASLLYEVSPLDVSVYAAVAVTFAFAALLAGDLPARRAARTDPADVLREE
jgi:putative ABC transport system permease protein